MGLDISVYKVKSIGNANPSDISDYYTLKERPELIKFKDFIFEKENSYYNLEKAATKKGLVLKNLEYIGIEFSSKVKYQFLNKKHRFAAWRRLPNVNLNFSTNFLAAFAKPLLYAGTVD